MSQNSSHYFILFAISNNSLYFNLRAHFKIVHLCQFDSKKLLYQPVAHWSDRNDMGFLFCLAFVFATVSRGHNGYLGQYSSLISSEINLAILQNWFIELETLKFSINKFGELWQHRKYILIYRYLSTNSKRNFSFTTSSGNCLLSYVVYPC